MNLNDLAKEVCEREGGKVNLPIAQVKEVIRNVFVVMGEAIDEGRGSEVFTAVTRISRNSRRRR